jgi:hypothetical protein
LRCQIPFCTSQRGFFHVCLPGANHVIRCLFFVSHGRAARAAASDAWGEQHDTGFAALAKHGYLAGIVARLQVAPGERAQSSEMRSAPV